MEAQTSSEVALGSLPTAGDDENARGSPRAATWLSSQIDCIREAENRVYVLWYSPGKKKIDCVSGALILSRGLAYVSA